MAQFNEIVEGFNTFFVEVGPNLANGISPSCTRDSCKEISVERISDSMSLGFVDKKEIMEVVNNYLNKTSTNGNNIDMHIVKSVIDAIADLLTHIRNRSFKSGTFPQKMKIAKVIPLFKSGDKHLFTNYRPVSLSSQFSKILEKLFERRLNNFVDRHKLFMDSQYGFRSGSSTSMALMELVEQITSCIEKKKYALGIFIDLKKAFDTIDHEILLKKMEIYGIRGAALDWIDSYISNRQQFVQLGKLWCPSRVNFGSKTIHIIY